MEDLSPFLSNIFMDSLYKKIENDYPQEKLSNIIQKMVLYYQSKQKDIITNSFENKKHIFPFSVFDKDYLVKCEINDKAYQELLNIIRNLDSDHPIFEKDGILK